MLAHLAARGRELPGVRDAWLELRELAIQFDPQQWDFAELADHCLDVGKPTTATSEEQPDAAHRHRFSMMDLTLNSVCETCSLSQEHLIECFENNVYTVALIGFLPHFPWLLGLDSRLQLPPNKSTHPRTSRQHCYRRHLCGRLPQPERWMAPAKRMDPQLLTDLQPGDTVGYIMHLAAEFSG